MDNKLVFLGIETGTVVVETILVLLYSQRLKLKRKSSRTQTIYAYVLFFFLLETFSILHISPWIRMLVSFLGLIGIFRLCYEIDLPNICYTTAIFLILAVIADVLCSFIVKYIGIYDYGIGDVPFSRITCNAIAKLIHLILLQLAVSFLHRKTANISFSGALPLLTAQISSLVVAVLLHYPDVHSGVITARTVTGVLAILYINIIICFYIESIGIKNELAHEKEAADREYQFKLKYYESIKQSQEETRSLWHEIQKYLNTMQTLIGSQENEAASKCMLEANQRFHDLTTTVDVGNPILNGILNLGVQDAKKYNIPLQMDVWVAETLGVAPQDLFIILGNAIDNAIEECSQLSSEIAPEIHVSIHQKGQLLLIKVDNPCRATPSKKPGKIHGYGLKNVQKCIAKYNGELQTKFENGAFHFFVLLNMN